MPERSRKKFECLQCCKSFCRMEHLRRHHVSAHVSRKEHACSFCVKAFARKDELQRHERMHARREGWTYARDADSCSVETGRGGGDMAELGVLMGATGLMGLTTSPPGAVSMVPPGSYSPESYTARLQSPGSSVGGDGAGPPSPGQATVKKFPSKMEIHYLI
ncbi:hypothetical protein BJ741DRAFT_601859, partial [Chytriomyces cf. hyalinus JEL632]